MNKHIKNNFETNWNDLKEKIQAQWKKLTNDDIEEISGSYEQLIAKLKKSYQLQSDEIENLVLAFLSNNNLMNSDDKKSPKIIDVPAIKDAISVQLEDYISYIKDKSHRLENSTKMHVQENPFKWLGVAALSGFVLAKIIKF